MYTTYQYNAAATQANVLSDLVKLITGETNKANLSTDCNQAGTTIISTDAAGWSVFDAAAGTNIQCVRALNQDAATYKYALLQFGTTTAYSVAIAEAWNASTHTGTNVTSYFGSTWSSTGGGQFFLYVTPKNIVIMSRSSATDQVASALHEISRDTIPAGYPCHVLSNGNWGRSDVVNGIMPRIKNAGATGDTLGTTTANTIIAPIGPLQALAISNFNSTYRDAAEIVKIATYKMGVAGLTNTIGSQQFGTAYDILGVSSQATTGANRDEIVINGITYVFYANMGAGGILLPKR